MSGPSPTPKVGYNQINTSSGIDVERDFSENWDLADRTPGIRPHTSTTLPPWDLTHLGMVGYDTGRSTFSQWSRGQIASGDVETYMRPLVPRSSLISVNWVTGTGSFSGISVQNSEQRILLTQSFTCSGGRGIAVNLSGGVVGAPSGSQKGVAIVEITNSEIADPFLTPPLSPTGPAANSGNVGSTSYLVERGNSINVSLNLSPSPKPPNTLVTTVFTVSITGRPSASLFAASGTSVSPATLASFPPLTFTVREV